MDAVCVSTLFETNGLVLTPGQVDALLEYRRLLLSWNEKINLVSRRVTDDFFLRHIVGSVSFLFRHPLHPRSTLVDVGTGGGLPGIPLAIIYPGARVLLVDSILKKIKAVTQISADLGLSNVSTLCSRVEELNPETTGKFDYVVARAVTGATRLVTWCSPLLSAPGPGSTAEPLPSHDGAERATRSVPKGSYIFLKGGDLTTELSELREAFFPDHPSGTVEMHALEVTVPGSCGPVPDDVLIEKKVIIVTP